MVASYSRISETSPKVTDKVYYSPSVSNEIKPDLRSLIIQKANQAVEVAKKEDRNTAEQFVQDNIRDHLGAASNAAIKAIILILRGDGRLDEVQYGAYRIICDLRVSQQ